MGGYRYYCKPLEEISRISGGIVDYPSRDKELGTASILIDKAMAPKLLVLFSKEAMPPSVLWLIRYPSGRKVVFSRSHRTNYSLA
jgi:hypothetical protein